MRRALIVLPIAIALLAVLWWSQRQTGPFFVSGFIEADDVRVGSRVGGRVSAVRVREGQRVAAEDVLVELDPYDLNEHLAEATSAAAARAATLSRLQAGYRVEEVAQARARRDRAQAVLDKLKAGQRPLEIQILEDKLRLAQAQFDDAQREYERLKTLREENRASPDEFETATRDYRVARARLDVAGNELALAKEGTRTEEIAEGAAALAEAAAALDLLEAGFRPEEVAEAQASLDAARAAVATVERQLRELSVVAPSDSVVEAVDLEPGDLIAPNAPVVTLLDPSSLWVRAYVPENRLDLKIGQKVHIAVDAFAGRRFSGHVSYIARQAEFTPSNVQTPEERSKQVFRIKVVLDEGLDVLRPGMAADVYFEAGP